MQKTCDGCKALTNFGNCLLGFKQTSKKLAFDLSIPCPSEECPKPRTNSKMSELAIKKDREEGSSKWEK